MKFLDTPEWNTMLEDTRWKDGSPEYRRRSADRFFSHYVEGHPNWGVTPDEKKVKIKQDFESAFAVATQSAGENVVNAAAQSLGTQVAQLQREAPLFIPGTLIPSPEDLVDAFRRDKKLETTTQKLEQSFPTRPGFSRSVGEFVGGTVPSIASNVAGALTGTKEAQAAVNIVTVLPFYFLGHRAALQEMDQIEKTEGRTISTARKESIAIASGVIEVGSEYLERITQLKFVKGIKLPVGKLARLGNAIEKVAVGGEDKVARKMLFDLGKAATGSFAGEGLEGWVGTVLENGVKMKVGQDLYGDLGAFEGAGSAFLQEGLGGVVSIPFTATGFAVRNHLDVRKQIKDAFNAVGVQANISRENASQLLDLHANMMALGEAKPDITAQELGEIGTRFPDLKIDPTKFGNYYRAVLDRAQTPAVKTPVAPTAQTTAPTAAPQTSKYSGARVAPVVKKADVLEPLVAAGETPVVATTPAEATPKPSMRTVRKEAKAVGESRTSVQRLEPLMQKLTEMSAQGVPLTPTLIAGTMAELGVSEKKQGKTVRGLLEVRKINLNLGQKQSSGTAERAPRTTSPLFESRVAGPTTDLDEEGKLYRVELLKKLQLNSKEGLEVSADPSSIVRDFLSRGLVSPEQADRLTSDWEEHKAKGLDRAKDRHGFGVSLYHALGLSPEEVKSLKRQPVRAEAKPKAEVRLGTEPNPITPAVVETQPAKTPVVPETPQTPVESAVDPLQDAKAPPAGILQIARQAVPTDQVQALTKSLAVLAQIKSAPEDKIFKRPDPQNPSKELESTKAEALAIMERAVLARLDKAGFGQFAAEQIVAQPDGVEIREGWLQPKGLVRKSADRMGPTSFDLGANEPLTNTPIQFDTQQLQELRQKLGIRRSINLLTELPLHLQEMQDEDSTPIYGAVSFTEDSVDLYIDLYRSPENFAKTLRHEFGHIWLREQIENGLVPKRSLLRTYKRFLTQYKGSSAYNLSFNEWFARQVALDQYVDSESFGTQSFIRKLHGLFVSLSIKIKNLFGVAVSESEVQWSRVLQLGKDKGVFFLDRGLSDEEFDFYQQEHPESLPPSAEAELAQQQVETKDETKSRKRSEKSAQKRASTLATLKTLNSDLIQRYAQGEGYDSWSSMVDAMGSAVDTDNKPKPISISALVSREIIWQDRMVGRVSDALVKLLSKENQDRLNGVRSALEAELKSLEDPSSIELKGSNVSWQGVNSKDLRSIVLPNPEIGWTVDRQAQVALDAAIEKIEGKYKTQVSKDAALEKLMKEPPSFKISMLPTEDLAKVVTMLQDLRRTAVLQKFDALDAADALQSLGMSEVVKTEKSEGKIGSNEKLPETLKSASFVSSQTAEHIFVDFFKFGSQTWDQLSRSLQQAREITVGLMAEVDKRMNAALGDNLINLVNIEKNQSSKTLRSGKVFVSTPAIRIGIAHALTDIDNPKATFSGSLWGFDHLKYDLTHEDALEIRDSLTAEEQQALKGLQDSYQYMQDRLLEFCDTLPPLEAMIFRGHLQHLYGMYAPRYIVNKDGSKTDPLTAETKTGNIHGLINVFASRWLQKREHTSEQKLQFVDPFAVLNDVSTAVGAAIGTAREVEKVRVFLKGDVRLEIAKTRLGKKRLKSLMNWLDAINGEQKYVEQGAESSVVSQLMKRFAPSYVSMNPSSYIIQWMSALTATLRVPPRYAAKVIAGETVVSWDEARAKAILIPTVADRFKRSIMDRLTPSETRRFTTSRKSVGRVQKFTGFGLAPMKWSDEKVIVFLYQQLLLQSKDEGWAQGEAERRLVETINSTQATTDPFASTEISRKAQEGNLVSQTLTLFNLDQIKVWNLYWIEVKRFRQSDRNPDDWRRLMWAQMVLGLLSWLMFSITKSVGQAVLKAPGAVYNSRTMQDFLAEIDPFTAQKLTQTGLQQMGGTVVGPLSKFIVPAIETVIAKAQGKGVSPNSQNLVESFGQDVISGTSGLIEVLKTFSEKDKWMQKNLLERQRQVIRWASDLMRIVALMGRLPLMPSRVTDSMASKDRAYYYDMLFDAKYHSNGIARGERDEAKWQDALRQLRALGADSESVRTALRQRLQK